MSSHLWVNFILLMLKHVLIIKCETLWICQMASTPHQCAQRTLW